MDKSSSAKKKAFHKQMSNNTNIIIREEIEQYNMHRNSNYKIEISDVDKQEGVTSQFETNPLDDQLDRKANKLDNSPSILSSSQDDNTTNSATNSCSQSPLEQFNSEGRKLNSIPICHSSSKKESVHEADMESLRLPGRHNK